MEDHNSDEHCTFCLKYKLILPLEFIALLMQLCALFTIPILLAHTENNFKNADKYMTLYILIPITLTIISVVWSGWLQKYIMLSVTENEKSCNARLKSGKEVLLK